MGDWGRTDGAPSTNPMIVPLTRSNVRRMPSQISPHPRTVRHGIRVPQGAWRTENRYTVSAVAKSILATPTHLGHLTDPRYKNGYISAPTCATALRPNAARL